MIGFTSGYTLTANDSTPGIKNFWVNTARIATFVGEGPVTGFTTVGGTGTWVALENADTEGDYTSTASAASGGLEWVLAGNFRIGGISQDKLDLVRDLISSSRVPLIAERTDGNYELLTRNGSSFGSAAITSGTGGGGAAGIGSALTFSAQDSNSVAVVTVATDLNAITDA